MSMPTCRQQFFVRGDPEEADPDATDEANSQMPCSCSECTRVNSDCPYCSGHQILDQEPEVALAGDPLRNLEPEPPVALSEDDGPSANNGGDTNEFCCWKVKEGIDTVKRYIEVMTQNLDIQRLPDEQRIDQESYHGRVLNQIHGLECMVAGWQEHLGVTGEFVPGLVPPVVAMLEKEIDENQQVTELQPLRILARKILEHRLICFWLFTLAMTFIWDYRLIAECLLDICVKVMGVFSELLMFNQAIVNKIAPVLFPLKKYVEPTPLFRWRDLEPFVGILFMTVMLSVVYVLRRKF